MKWIGYLTDKTYNFADKFQDYGVYPAYIVKHFALTKKTKKRHNSLILNKLALKNEVFFQLGIVR